MNPGDVARVHYPLTAGGRKLRPTLVVAESPTGFREDQVIVVAQITGHEELLEKPFHGDLLVPDWEDCGLRAPSVVRCRQLFSAQPSDIHDLLGVVPDNFLAEVFDELKILFADTPLVAAT